MLTYAIHSLVAPGMPLVQSLLTDPVLTSPPSYCNSIVQCLYYSAPFREQVLNFPARSPQETLKRKSAALSPIEDNSSPNALSPAKSKGIFSAPQPASPSRAKQLAAPAGTGPQAPKAEENKDSAEYKKKIALTTGPVLNMNYENSTAYGMDESLFTSLKDIFEAIIAHESRIGVVSPHKFLEILRRDNEMFRTPMHQDAHEFLNLLLNQVLENVEQFSKGIGEKKAEADSSSETSLVRGPTPVMNSGVLGNAVNSRWVHELFEGTLTSETRCLTCENISQRDEAFLDLSVDLEMHSSVTSCLRRFSEEEMLCERNKFHCDMCGGLQEAEKRMKIKALPRILALHLKRFKYTEDMQRLQKLFHRVVYPYYLRLFNTTDDAEDPDRLYELYAVVVHIGGGPYHGHYVSIIKTQDRGWLLFDDEMVEPVDKRFVTKFFGEGMNAQGHPVNLACAYVLFYQETTEEAMQREMEAENAAFAHPEPLIDPLAKLKTNGIATNGVHHAHSPTTPLSGETDQFASLDHAATIQMPPPPAAPFHPLETVQTLPAIPFLKRKKSAANVKREQERAEKEERERRKAEEKEHERQVKEMDKQAKKRQKDEDVLRKENLKRQEEELAARYKAAGQKGPSSNASSSRAGDDDTGSYSSTTTGNRGSGQGIEEQLFPTHHHHLTPQPVAQQPPLPPTSHPKENGVLSSTPPTNGSPGAGASGSMLHRFRNTSMSLRQKPKFWSKEKDKEKTKGKNSGDHSDLSREAFAVQPQHRSLTPSDTTIDSTSSGMGTPQFNGISGPVPRSSGGPRSSGEQQGLGVRLGHELFPPPPLASRNFIATPSGPVSSPFGVPAPFPPPPQPQLLDQRPPLESRKSTEKPKKESRFGLGRKKSVAGLLSGKS
jgi:ubiquitin carboxyl-terminal hydrolase 9/13